MFFRNEQNITQKLGIDLIDDNRGTKMTNAGNE